ncbi:alpha/beta hydrolase [Candidatus Woesearchaeota archaeon]|nr:alpha/beta hydrolase [Candidatus Woesearchaeota archaeon]
MSLKIIIINIFILFLFLYVLFGLYLFYNQKSMIYFPDSQDFDSCSGFADYLKINQNGTRVYYKQGLADKAIIFYHGNAGSACDRSYLRQIFEQSNASLLFVEFAGYSNDNKKPSQKLIFEDVRNVARFVNENSFKEVLVYGESIGSGAASYHASIGKVDSLILVSPFSSLDDVAQIAYAIYPAKIILREKYDNIKWLKGFEGGILILHGDNDSVIPNRFSRKLFEKMPSAKKEYVLVEGFGHNDIWDSSLFRDKVIDFISRPRH